MGVMSTVVLSDPRSASTSSPLHGRREEREGRGGEEGKTDGRSSLCVKSILKLKWQYSTPLPVTRDSRQDC